MVSNIDPKAMIKYNRRDSRKFMIAAIAGAAVCLYALSSIIIEVSFDPLLL